MPLTWTSTVSNPVSGSVSRWASPGACPYGTRTRTRGVGPPSPRRGTGTYPRPARRRSPRAGGSTLARRGTGTRPTRRSPAEPGRVHSPTNVVETRPAFAEHKSRAHSTDLRSSLPRRRSVRDRFRYAANACPMRAYHRVLASDGGQGGVIDARVQERPRPRAARTPVRRSRGGSGSSRSGSGNVANRPGRPRSPHRPPGVPSGGRGARSGSGSCSRGRERGSDPAGPKGSGSPGCRPPPS